MAELKRNYAFNLKDALKRVIFLFEETQIDVKFINDFSGLELAGIKIDSIPRGQKTTLPLFLARILHKQGLIEYFNDPSITLSDLHAKQWEQERAASLQPIPQFLYIQLLQKLLEIKETLRTDSSSYLTQERQRFETTFRQLLLDRENKILRNLTSSFIPSSTKNLSASEQVLIKYLTSILKEWEELLLSSEHSEE